MKRSVFLLLATCGVAACHKSCSYSGSTSVSFGTDGGVVASAAVDASADAATSAGPADGGLVAPRFAGVFHLPASDEIDLALEPNGTFHWRIAGCSAVQTSCGRWAAKGSLVVLTPVGTATTLEWVNARSRVEHVTRVDVAEHAGHLELRAYLPDGTSFAQVWHPGRVCAPCGGEGGTPPSLCNSPLPSNCP